MKFTRDEGGDFEDLNQRRFCEKFPPLLKCFQTFCCGKVIELDRASLYVGLKLQPLFI